MKTPFLTCRQSLVAYLYAYTRTLELACGWTMVVRDLPFKVALGRVIGYAGVGLSSLSRRLGQMYASGAKPAAPARYAAWLDEQATLCDERRIAAFLVTAYVDLSRAMKGYLSASHPGDEPTILLLESLILNIDRAVAVLRAYADGTVPPVSIADDGERIEYTGKEPLPPIPERPARPAAAVRDPEIANRKPQPLAEAMEPENLAAFFKHMYMEVEIAAIEVCSRNIVEYREMPLTFKVDMTQQIWDEARHAELAVTLIKSQGVEFDTDHVCYSGMVWDRYELGLNLPERLAIEQCIQEGNSVDRAAAMCPMLRKWGHAAAAEAFEWINSDEVQHAAIGNRWLMRLCDNSRERYEAVLKSANEKIKFPLPRPNREMRAESGFPSWYVERLEREFAANQQRKR
jgi:uncharacterized ferritin-like protein (DUF455 family)